MPDLDVAAWLVGAAAAFVIGFVYYGITGDVTSAAAPRRAGWQVGLVEIVRCLLLALVVAIVAARMDVDTWYGGLALGALLWIGFPVVLLTGAMFHEGAPLRSSAVHAGDWLLKLLATGLIVALLA